MATMQQINELISGYIERANAGDFDMGIIRREMEAHNIEEETIHYVIKQVDNALVNQAASKVNRSHGREWMIGGGIMTIIGAGITIGTYAGTIHMGDSFLIVYGPVGTGLSLMFHGWKRMKNQTIKTRSHYNKPDNSLPFGF